MKERFFKQKNMKKYIDRILYFFGYAPIKISHEVKYHFVIKEMGEMKFDVLRVVECINQRDFNIIGNDRIKEELRIKILREIEKYIIFNSTKSIQDNYVRISAILYIGTIK